MKRYCFNCDAERNVREELRRQSFVVKGESVEFDAPVLVCEHCQETVFDPDYDGKILQTANDLYRQHHGLLRSGEIARLRERYGLSQRALARMLGWGEVTIQRYEKGAIQDRAHDEVLRSLYDPRRVLEFLERSDRLTKDERERVRRVAQTVLEKERPTWLVRDTEHLLRASPSDRYHGFRDFDIKSFVDVVTWFAARVNQLSKTKLAKLLWLADFKHFRDHGVSITGAAYARLPFGPVPDNFQILLGVASAIEAIRLEEEFFGDFPGEVVRALKAADEHEFEDEVLATLTFVLEKFGHYSAKQLTELSHREEAWLKRADGELIPYDEAKDIKLLDS